MVKWELTVFQDAAINCRQSVIYFGESLAKRVSLPISRAQLDVLMKQYGELARISKEKRHFHALKHSIATYLLETGAELSFVQDWLGHADIGSTVVYSTYVNPARERKARTSLWRCRAFERIKGDGDLTRLEHFAIEDFLKPR